MLLLLLLSDTQFVTDHGAAIVKAFVKLWNGVAFGQKKKHASRRLLLEKALRILTRMLGSHPSPIELLPLFVKELCALPAVLNSMQRKPRKKAGGIILCYLNIVSVLLQDEGRRDFSVRKEV